LPLAPAVRHDMPHAAEPEIEDSPDSDGRLVCVCGVSCGDHRAPFWLNDAEAEKGVKADDGVDYDSPSHRPENRAVGPFPGFQGLLSAMRGNRPLSALLVFVPLGFISHFAGWARWLVFLYNFVAILPMAWLIGKSTEDLSVPCGDVLGGLLNATFGNVVEMLLCVAGIRQNELDVVQATLVGSILSNLLLVMGTSFLWGGYWHHSQKFSKSSGSIQSSLLLLAVMGVVLPTMYASLVPGGSGLLNVSRGISVLMFFMYLQYLVFQLYTHAQIFQGSSDADATDGTADDEDEEVDMTPVTAALVLAACTFMTAACSEYLIGSIKGTIDHWHVTKEFVGVIILPIIGNAAEHYSAIVVAGRKKMDLSLNIAVGSACQMALLVTPFTVLAGWVMDTEMNLNFHPFQAAVLLLSVLVVANILKDGDANWLEGSMLTSAYGVIAFIYFFDRAYLAGMLGKFD